MPKCIDGDKLEILPGKNVWVIFRTDRDSVDRESAIDTLGAYLSRVFTQATPGHINPVEHIFEFDTETGLSKFILGAARPVIVKSAERLPLAEVAKPGFGLFPGAQSLGYAPNCKKAMFVKATSPWVFMVEFDWRGPRTLIPWPHRLVSAFGIGDDNPDPEDSTELDWLVVSAWSLGKATHPDESLGTKITDVTTEAAKDAGKAIAKAAGFGLNQIALTAGVLLAGLVLYNITKGK